MKKLISINDEQWHSDQTYCHISKEPPPFCSLSFNIQSMMLFCNLFTAAIWYYDAVCFLDKLSRSEPVTVLLHIDVMQIVSRQMNLR